jgi:hypothetical protein
VTKAQRLGSGDASELKRAPTASFTWPAAISTTGVFGALFVSAFLSFGVAAERSLERAAAPQRENEKI